MTKKATYSTTAGTNASGIAGVNFAEGQNPSTVNDSIREILAIEKSYLLDNQSLTTAGTSTAYTVTTNQSMAAPADGDTLVLKMHTTCGATPTLAVDGGTARSIVHQDGSLIAAGDMSNGNRYLVRYDTANTRWALGAGELNRTTADTLYGRKGGANTWAGVQTILTAAQGTNTTQAASTAFVQTEIGNAAWTLWTPTITAETGTITGFTSSGRYVKIGRTVICQIRIDISNAGTGTGAMIATLPFTAAARSFSGGGNENAATGFDVSGLVLSGGSTVFVRRVDWTTPIATGRGYTLDLVFEANA